MLLACLCMHPFCNRESRRALTNKTIGVRRAGKLNGTFSRTTEVLYCKAFTLASYGECLNTNPHQLDQSAMPLGAGQCPCSANAGYLASLGGLCERPVRSVLDGKPSAQPWRVAQSSAKAKNKYRWKMHLRKQRTG